MPHLEKKNAARLEGRRINTRWGITNLVTILFKKKKEKTTYNMFSLAGKVGQEHSTLQHSFNLYLSKLVAEGVIHLIQYNSNHTRAENKKGKLIWGECGILAELSKVGGVLVGSAAGRAFQDLKRSQQWLVLLKTQLLCFHTWKRTKWTRYTICMSCACLSCHGHILGGKNILLTVSHTRVIKSQYGL